MPRHPPTLAIDFVDDRSLTSPAQRAWLGDRACAALAGLAVRGEVRGELWGEVRGEVRARIVGDAEMAEAHLRWSGVPGTTDVLTFDLAEGRSAGGEPLDVDLLLCADEARRQADARGFPVERELLLYLLHGVLHCLGHDDHDEDAFARMHAEEDRLLEAAGVGATYGVDAGGAGR